ncbi:MAG: peptide deformylase [Candidatus Omnitrophota bacterium]
MSRLDIKIYPDKILRQKARPVGKIDKVVQGLVCDMMETMRQAEGVGLAAPQIGISKRIIVAEDAGTNRSAIALINPRILKKKGNSHFCEGCLSVPGVTSDIIRPESIIVEGLDPEGEILKIQARGFFARVIQHEIDHLDGILFIDRVSFFKRRKIIKQISSKVCMKL